MPENRAILKDRFPSVNFEILKKPKQSSNPRKSIEQYEYETPEGRFHCLDLEIVVSPQTVKPKYKGYVKEYTH